MGEKSFFKIWLSRTRQGLAFSKGKKKLLPTISKDSALNAVGARREGGLPDDASFGRLTNVKAWR